MSIDIDDEPLIIDGNKYALLIGVGAFKDDKVSNLSGVPIDIKNLNEILTKSDDPFYYVKTLTDTKLIDTRKAISDTCSKAAKDDMILFYYSGHGTVDREKNFYMLMHDSEKNYLHATCLDAEYILSQFRKSLCEKIIIIIDACHSGAFFNNSRGLPKGLVALTSSREDQLSREIPHEGGLFTNLLVKGLKSEYIDANRDGKITFSEIFNYIVMRTEEIKLEQRPQKWEWNIGGDMVIFDSPKLTFISYKRERKEFVTKLSAELNKSNIPTFVDQEKLRIGDNWRKEIEKTIKNSRVLLIILDQSILYSKVSNWEIETAYKHNIPILPIVIEDIKIHAMFEARYGHINRFVFNHDNVENSIEIIIDHIKNLRITQDHSNSR